jgi:hypothetical protein
MTARTARRRADDLALVAAFSRAVYDGRELRGHVHQTEDGWLAEDVDGKLLGTHLRAQDAVHAVLDAGRRP